MSKEIDLKTYLAKAKKLKLTFLKHGSFIAVLVILFIYLFVVWRISSLATAEPTSTDESNALSSTNIPRVDKNAINQIQTLENNNIQVHSLFNSARNNPFHE